MRPSWLLAAGFAVSACNAAFDAGEPSVVDDRGQDTDHPDGGEEAGAPPCGDGKVQPGEECDDGNEIDGDGCDHCMECGPAPELLNPTSRHCYRLAASDTLAWDGAEADCAGWGGTLAAVTSADELAFVQNHVNHDIWIGGRAEGGAYKWITGEAWGFDSWIGDRPEPVDGECVLIDGDLLAFDVLGCDEGIGLLCEREPPHP